MSQLANDWKSEADFQCKKRFEEMISVQNAFFLRKMDVARRIMVLRIPTAETE